jgi:hypothetical protein
MKNYGIFAGILALALVFGLIACEGPVGPAGSGTPGVGTPGTSYLEGARTTRAIQYAIDAGGPLTLIGVTQSDPGSILIPAGRGVKIVGTFTTEGSAASVLVIADDSSVEVTDGNIVGGSGAAIISTQTFIDTGKVAGTVVVPFATASSITDGTIPSTSFIGGVAAIKGNVNVKTTGAAAGEISLAQLIGSNVFIYGDLTVTNDVAAASINVLGNVSAAGTITSALSASGNVESTKAITGVGAIGINVKGNLNLKGATADGALSTAGTTGTIKVGGNLTAVSVATGTATDEALSVDGTATIGTLTPGAAIAQITFGKTAAVGAYTAKGTATADVFNGKGPLTITAFTDIASASTVTFNLPTTLTDAVTVLVSNTFLAGTGAVTLTAAPVITGNNLIITNTGGVTFGAGLAATSGTIKVASGGTIVVPATKAIVFNSILELGPGAYTGLQAGATITASTGAIVTGGAGGDGLRIGDATNYVSLTDKTSNAATFTPTAGTGAAATKVVFGSAGIVLGKSDTNGSILHVTGTSNVGVVTVAGTSTITLGGDAAVAKKGTLRLINTAELVCAATYAAAGGSAAPSTGIFAGAAANGVLSDGSGAPGAAGTAGVDVQSNAAANADYAITSAATF